MGLLLNLAAITVRPLIGSICETAGVAAGGSTVDRVVGLLERRFVDHSQRLLRALQTSNDRAWKALEVSLAGDSWWESVKLKVVASGEEKAFRQQVLSFLRVTPLPKLAGKADFRQRCLHELLTARKRGVLAEANVDLRGLAHQAGSFARFTDHRQLLDAEVTLLVGLAGDLRTKGYGNLGWLLEQRPEQGDPLLVAASRYFFRRAVQTDEELFRGLMLSRMEESLAELGKLGQGQAAGFEALEATLVQNAAALEAALADLAGRLEAQLGAVREAVERVEETGEDTNSRVRQLEQKIERLLDLAQMQDRELRPRDSRSIHSEREQKLVNLVVEEYQRLPPDRVARLPGLNNSLGKVIHAAGRPARARQFFLEAARSASDPAVRAEAYYNAYQAALEANQFDEALESLCAAASIDAERFAPFPLQMHEPVRILGAGGFGTVFLCQHRLLKRQVVVKTLHMDCLDRDVDDIFGEARIVDELDHPAIIRLRDCGFACANRQRAYLVMDYFDGVSLEEYVRKNGTLPLDDLLRLACQAAEGLRAAHGKGILHRDVKPANLLVRKDDGWRVKLIDFGLAVRQAMKDTVQTAAQSSSSGEIAGTFEYAAPEQTGKLPGVPVGPYSDVYGFGKMCCFALFGTVSPLRKHWKQVPDALADLLEGCLEEAPNDRPQDFAAVLTRLRQIGAGGPGRPAGTPPVAVLVNPVPAIPVATPAPPAPAASPAPGKRVTVPVPRGGTVPVLAPFTKVSARPLPDGRTEVEATIARVPEFAGARAGLALDASESMKEQYGILVKRGPFDRRPAPPNEVERLVRQVGSFLARFASDGKVGLAYWACGMEGAQVEVIGQLDERQCAAAAIAGPVKQAWGRNTRLLPPLRYFVDDLFRDAGWAICVFLTDGAVEDLEEVKEFSRRFAREIAAGRRSFIKLVLIGVGNAVKQEQMEELDDMFKGSGLRDPQGNDIDLWDQKVAREMSDLKEIFAEVVSRNTIVARKGRILDPASRVVADFPEGVPALMRFTLPAGGAAFTLEYS